MNPLPILQHLESNRILPTDILLLRINPNIQVIRNQIIVRPILPISPPQQIQPRRRHLRIIHLRRRRRRSAHLLLRTLPDRRLPAPHNKPAPPAPEPQSKQTHRRHRHESSRKTEPLYTLLRRAKEDIRVISLTPTNCHPERSEGSAFVQGLQTKRGHPTMPSPRFPSFQFLLSDFHPHRNHLLQPLITILHPLLHPRR